MALSTLFIELGVKILIAVMFVAFGSLILREIVARIFHLEDDTVATASSVVIWTVLVMLIFSFLPSSAYWGIATVVIVNILFALLVKRYYKVPWKTTAAIWGVWFGVYFVIALLAATAVTVAF